MGSRPSPFGRGARRRHQCVAQWCSTTLPYTYVSYLSPTTTGTDTTHPSSQANVSRSARGGVAPDNLLIGNHGFRSIALSLTVPDGALVAHLTPRYEFGTLQHLANTEIVQKDAIAANLIIFLSFESNQNPIIRRFSNARTDRNPCICAPLVLLVASRAWNHHSSALDSEATRSNSHVTPFLSPTTTIVSNPTIGAVPKGRAGPGRQNTMSQGQLGLL